MNNILEETVCRLLQKNRFFANLLQQFHRHYVDDNHQVKTAAVSITDKINLYVYLPYFQNPYKVQELTEEQVSEIKNKLGKDFDKWNEGYQDRLKKAKKVENPTKKQIELAQEAILIHECLHIINTHIPRAKNLSTDIAGTKFQFNHQAMNIAMDCAINQLAGIDKPIEEIGGVTLESFKEMLDDDSIEPGQTFEYYFNKMHENAEKLIQKYGEGLQGLDNHDDHGEWKDGEATSNIQEEMIKDAVKKAEKQTGAGNISGDVKMLIDNLFESKVNWKNELRRFMQGFVKFTHKQTRSKRNRKYGILFAGKKKKYHTHIAVPVDMSGSMSHDDIKRCFSEIHKIATTIHAQITVIEADSEVKNVYEYDPKNPPQPVGGGGTAYQPAIDKALELGVNGIIYLGDMDAFDTPKDPKIPVLWGVVGSRQKPPADFGKVIYIEEEND